MISRGKFLAFAVSLNVAGVAIASSLATADDFVGAEIISGLGVVSAKQQRLGFFSPVGAGIHYDADLSATTFFQFSYECFLKNNSLLLHGPSVNFGYRVFGNNSFVETTEVNRVVVKYPLSITVLAGLVFRMHDFSSLQDESKKAFSEGVQFFKQGLLVGANLGVDIGFKPFDQLYSHVFVKTVAAKALQLGPDAMFTSVEWGLSVAYAL